MFSFIIQIIIILTISHYFSNCIPTNGLVVYYPLNGTKNDFSGNNFHCTTSGSGVGPLEPIETDYGGKMVYSYFFNGIDDHFVCGNDELMKIDGNNGLTIMALIKHATGNTKEYENIVLKGGHSYGLQLKETSSFNFYLYDDPSYRVFVSKEKVKESEWIHITGVWDNLESTVKLFINGVVDYKENGVIDITVNDEPLTIGKAVNGNNFYFHGFIREVAIYERALYDKEILNIYNSLSLLKDENENGNETTLFILAPLIIIFSVIIIGCIIISFVISMCFYANKKSRKRVNNMLEIEKTVENPSECTTIIIQPISERIVVPESLVIVEGDIKTLIEKDFIIRKQDVLDDVK